MRTMLKVDTENIYLQFNEGTLEVPAIGIGPHIQAVQKVQVLPLEQGFLGQGLNFRRLVQGLLGNDQVAGNHVGYGIQRHGMGHSPHPLRIAHQRCQLRIAIQLPGQVEEGFPHLELEGRTKEPKVLPT